MQERKAWSQEQIAEVIFNPETRLLGFHTVELTGFAVIQARHIDFPYSSWSLNPQGNDRALLNLATPRFNIAIEIDGKSCMLRDPTDVPELSDILGKPMSPAQLLQALKRCGINLMPVDEDATFVTMGEGEGAKSPLVKVGCGVWGVGVGLTRLCMRVCDP